LKIEDRIGFRCQVSGVSAAYSRECRVNSKKKLNEVSYEQYLAKLILKVPGPRLHRDKDVNHIFERIEIRFQESVKLSLPVSVLSTALT